jgi:hypothetical protein
LTRVNWVTESSERDGSDRVAGAGLIGRRHIEEVDVSRSAELVLIVEPGPVFPDLARNNDVASGTPHWAG